MQKKPEQPVRKLTALVPCVLLLCALFINTGTDQSMAAPNGANMFKKKCAMCHKDGGNRTSPKKPVIGSKFIKTKKGFKAYLSQKHGLMPAFPKIAGNDAALTALHSYVKGLK